MKRNLTLKHSETNITRKKNKKTTNSSTFLFRFVRICKIGWTSICYIGFLYVNFLWSATKKGKRKMLKRWIDWIDGEGFRIWNSGIYISNAQWRNILVKYNENRDADRYMADKWFWLGVSLYLRHCMPYPMHRVTTFDPHFLLHRQILF